jgi:predicted Rossmann-fold nucleotide-binding protein
MAEKQVHKLYSDVAKPSFDRKPTIAVIGGGKCTAQEAALAETVGRELAKRGAVLVCGG